MKKSIIQTIIFIVIISLLISSLSFNTYAAENVPYPENLNSEFCGFLYPGTPYVDENGIYRGLSKYGRRIFNIEDVNARPYFEVDIKTGTATFYSGENVRNELIGKYDTVPSYHVVYGLTYERVIERMVFTSDYFIDRLTLVALDNLKDIILLNGAVLEWNVGSGVIKFDDRFKITVYGTDENQRGYADEYNYEFRYLNDVELCAAEDTAISVDNTENLITGLEPKISSEIFIRDYLSPKACDAFIESGGNYVGTGSKVNLVKWFENSDAGSYDILLYGDVDGDGIYDARDAFYVNLMADGLLTEEQAGSLKWSAADCNHDGEVNADDVQILEQAGLLLSQVDQNVNLSSQ